PRLARPARCCVARRTPRLCRTGGRGSARAYKGWGQTTPEWSDPGLAGALELAVLLRVQLAAPEDPDAERDRDDPDDDHRPDVTPHGADARPVEDCAALAAQRVGRRRDLGDPLHELRQHGDGVVDAGDDQHQALRDVAELRPI